MYFIGCTSVFLICAISYERYCRVKYTKTQEDSNRIQSCFKIITICIFLGLLFSTMPLFGWSYYTFEGAGTSCSVAFTVRTFNVLSYNITIFIFVFFVPMGFILTINILLFSNVSLQDFKAFFCRVMCFLYLF